MAKAFCRLEHGFARWGVAAAAVAAAWSLLADTEQIGRHVWQYEVRGGSACVEGVTPAPHAGVPLVIPSRLGGFPVREIDDYAFWLFSSLTEVEIPAGVMRIGEDAFAYCPNLRSVKIPDGVTEIGGLAFADCAKLTSVRIPASVMRIHDEAFRGCAGLTSVTIPAAVTGIGDLAFDGCVGLNSIMVDPGNLSYRSENGCLLGAHAWYDEPGETLLACCASVKDLVIPEGVTRVEYGALCRAENLVSVTIPASMTQAYDKSFGFVFSGTTNLKSIGVAPGNPSYSSRSGCLLNREATVLVKAPAAGDVVIPEGVTAVGESAFAGCVNLTSVTIPASLTGYGLFSARLGDCARLKSIVVDPANPSFRMENGCLLSMDGTCLVACLATGDVEIPEGVTEIRGGVFCRAAELTSVRIPASVTRILDWPFCDCTGLTSIVVDPANLSYRSANGCLLNQDGTALLACPAVGDVVIPEGVRTMEGLHRLGGATSVTIPASLTGLEHELRSMSGGPDFRVAAANPVFSARDGFLLNKSGTQVLAYPGRGVLKVPAGVSSIPEEWIGGDEVENYEVKAVVLPSGVSAIGSGAFWGCMGMESVRIPSSVWSVGWHAFSLCTALKRVYVDPGDAHRVRDMLMATTPGIDWSDIAFIVGDGTGLSGTLPSLLDAAGLPAGTPAPYETAACVYEGYLQEASGAPAGTIQVKVAKGKVDAKTGVFAAKTTASAILADGTKLAFKNAVADLSGRVGEMTAGGRVLRISLGVDALAGTLDGWTVAGVRNVFSRKSAADGAAATDALAAWQGTVNVVADGVYVGVAIGAKGKSKISGTAGGATVSAASQLLVGQDWCAVPVVVSKKARLAFMLWLPRGGGTPVVSGLVNAFAGRPGSLRPGAALWSDSDALADAFGAAGGELLHAYLPDGLHVAEQGGKWIVANGAKAGKVVFLKGTQEVDGTKTGLNPSRLKLSCKPKGGTFKGTFKAHVVENGRIKAYSVGVAGVLVDGVGYGEAVLRKPAATWCVSVE